MDASDPHVVEGTEPALALLAEAAAEGEHTQIALVKQPPVTAG